MSIFVSRHEINWEQAPRPKVVGLALGGGAARGAAHIGVLQVLEENGIYPNRIAGTSVGALVGGLYAAGTSPARLEQIMASMRWRDLASINMPSISFSSFSRAEGSLSFLEGATGLLDLDKMIGWIDSILGGPVDFEHLNIPFVAVATELVTGAMFALNTGSISPAIRASCSVPGIFTPVTRDGRTLVDGVVSNNLPTSVARGMGADYVIAVDLLPSGGATMLTRKQDRVYVPRNVIDVTMHAIYALIRTTQHDLMTADCHITPAIGHIAFSDLGQQSQMLAIGRQAAEAAVPQILADLKRL